jgi:hypothetical protein
MSDRWLEDLGERVRLELRVRPVEFLIERELQADESTRLYDELRRRYNELWRPVLEPCLALAAVHAAASASREDTSFIELFYRRLGMSPDRRSWEDVHGPSVLRFFEEHFPDRPDAYDRPGPWCYVRVVYRHAGIPAVGLGAFAQLLRRLVRDYGRNFTRQDYDAALPAPLPRCVSDFLDSDTGYRFTAATAGVLFRLQLSSLPDHDLDSIPGYRRGFWRELRELLRQEPVETRPDGYSPPFLALDTALLQLQVRFDKAGVVKGAYTYGGRRILSPTLPVDSRRRPSGLYRLPERANWDIPDDQWWWPGRTNAALFRVSDGRFVASGGPVRPGDYYLVAAQGVAPPSNLVREDLGALELGPTLQEDDYFFVFRVSLSAGQPVADLGFVVTGSAPIPTVEFAEGFFHPRLGKDVFIGELPHLVISNWSEGAARDYWLWVEIGGHCRRLSPVPGRSEHRVDAPVPCQGRVILEPRGFLRHGGEPQVLSFAVVPRGIRFRWRTFVVGADDPAHLDVQLPRGWNATWQNAEAHSAATTGGQLVRVSPAVYRLDGQLSCDAVSLAVSIRVPRVGLEVEGHLTPIIWIDSADASAPMLRLEGPPRSRLTLVALDEVRTQTVWEGTPMPRSGLREINWLEWATAARLLPGVASELAVHPRGADFVRTAVYTAFSAKIRERIGTIGDNSAAFDLPGIGSGLRSAAAMVRQPQSVSCIAESAMSAGPLAKWLVTLALCAQTFDGTELSPPIDRSAEAAPAGLLDLLRWVRAAREAHVRLEARPAWSSVLDAELQALPVARWRQVVRSLLADTPDPARLLCQWRDCIVRRSRAAAQVLGNSPGSHTLSEGARRYLEATSRDLTEPGRRRALVDAVRDLRVAEDMQDAPRVLQVAARCLRQLALYRLGELGVAGQLSIDYPSGPFACLAVSMAALAGRCLCQEYSPTWPPGIGFADLSPYDGDAELERELGRPALDDGYSERSREY